MKPSEVGKPYPTEQAPFMEAVYKMSQHELHEKMLRVKAESEMLKNEAVGQLILEIKSIVNDLPMLNQEEKSSINSRVLKLVRVMELFYAPERT